jgi:hypothetical protein
VDLKRLEWKQWLYVKADWLTELLKIIPCGPHFALHAQVLPHVYNTYLSLSINNDAPHYSFIYNIYNFSVEFFYCDTILMHAPYYLFYLFHVENNK